MNEKKNSIFKLLGNEHFVRWVQHPTEESNHYWTKWIANHATDKRDIEIARRIIQSGSLKKDQLISEEGYARILENIMDYARKANVQDDNRLPNLWRYIGIAAAVILAILGSVFIIKNSSGLSGHLAEVKTIVKEAPYGNKLITKLPDGTRVSLNSGSVISFSEKFDEGIREVRLSGEAYFEVAHNPSQPFVVHFSGQHVQVLGTSFNIRSYENENITSVAVAAGKVSYSVLEGEEVILKPNEMASHIRGTSKLKKCDVNLLDAFGWRDRILYFNSDTYDDIKMELERWFGVTINTSRDFKPEGTYNGKFENATLKEVLTGLSFIYRFDFRIEGPNVSITKPIN